jgi:hypothetical protein
MFPISKPLFAYPQRISPESFSYPALFPHKNPRIWPILPHGTAVAQETPEKSV